MPGLFLCGFLTLHTKIDEFLYGTTHYNRIYESVRSTITSAAGNANISPTEFSLEQNYPNPFNPSTVIRYSVLPDVRGQASDVKLSVYNNLGKEIMTLVNEIQPAGIYSVEFNAENLSSGVYYLIVYDLLGREVKTLVNSQLTTGKYEFEFTGNNLASGVYFYRIEAVENSGKKFVQTKRMVLVK